MYRFILLLSLIIFLFPPVFAQNPLEKFVSVDYDSFRPRKQSWLPDPYYMVNSLMIPLGEKHIVIETEDYKEWEIREVGLSEPIGYLVFYQNKVEGLGWKMKWREDKYDLAISSYMDNTNDPRSSFIIGKSDTLFVFNWEPDANSHFGLLDHDPGYSYNQEDIIMECLNNRGFDGETVAWNPAPDWETIGGEKLSGAAFTAFVFMSVVALNVRYLGILAED